MSRIGKKGIEVPEKTEVTVADGVVTVTGPKGSISRDFPEQYLSLEKGEGSTLLVKPVSERGHPAILWGTLTSHISNMVHGVNEGFEKKLIVEGVGYKADVQGNVLDMALGFSHPVKVNIPEGIDVSVEKNVITVSGIDKEKVGGFASTVKSYRKPEPYKGKGIRYEGEYVRRKQGKKMV